MRKTIVFVAVTTAVVVGLLLSGCGQQQTQQQAAQPSPQTAQTQPQAQPAQQTAQVYPINWCVVSGEELGKMGDPVVYDYKGRTIKFCCKMCIKTFEKDPDRYMAKLDSAAAGQIKQPAAKPEEGTGG